MGFKVGEVVRTIKGSKLEAVGPVHKIIQPNKGLRLLWDSDEPHYLIKDNQSGEYLSVIERGLEKV
jgi:hypothetical protein